MLFCGQRASADPAGGQPHRKTRPPAPLLFASIKPMTSDSIKTDEKTCPLDSQRLEQLSLAAMISFESN
jgi:hypothetical protein